MSLIPAQTPPSVASAAVLPVVPAIYAVRAVAFACAFAIIGLHLRNLGAGGLAYALLALQFLAYPAALYLHLRRARDRRETAHRHLLADSFLLGAWTSGLGFPEWIGFSLVFTTLLNATIVLGPAGVLRALTALGLGALAGILAVGYRVAPETSPLVTQLCMLAGLAYLLGVGQVAYRRTASLIEARRAQRHSEERYRLIAEHAGDIVMLLDVDCRLLYSSPSCARILAPEDLETGVDAFRRVVEEDWLPTWTRVRATLRTGEPDGFDFRVHAIDGSLRTLAGQCQAVRDDHGVLVGAVLAARDVTSLRRHEEKAHIAARAFERMSEAMLITDAQGRIEMINGAFSTVTGYRADEVVGRNERDFRTAMQPASFYETLYEEVGRSGKWSGATWSQRKDGTVYREWRSVSAVRDEGGEITHYVNLFFEVGSPGAVSRAA